MNCTNCGYELNENARFCGHCGEAVQQPSNQKTGKYINIGHPLGYTMINNRIEYLIDNGLQQMRLSQEDFAIWAKLPQQQPTPDTAAILERAECIMNLEDAKQINQLMECVPYRQGFGAAHDGKHAVVLGRTPVYITEMQMIIWRLADGRNTLSRIGKMVGIDEQDVLAAIRELVGYDLLYVKFVR